MRHRYLTADVFTERAFGGNAVAVFPDARSIPESQMQRVAREFNLSETVFVLPPEDPANTRALRIFTPAAEVPFAGHPTVGTAFVLAAIGDVALAGETTEIVFEEGVGPVPVAIRAAGGEPVFSQLSAAQLPEPGPAPPAAADIAAAISLNASDLLGGGHAPEGWSCGLAFLFVALKDRDAVGRMKIDPAAWDKAIADYPAVGVFAFAFDPELDGSDLHARMFAPAYGVAEDPATGSAAAALAGYLGARDDTADGTLSFVIEQGFEMGRPSLVEMELDKKAGAIAAVRVGGASVLVSEGEMEIPET
jgi:trans-2,3-dihydro-3-hydroxyanthranilate isomerase